MPEWTVQERRERFAAMMAPLPVPEGIHTQDTSLGGRPALRITPDGPARPGIMLYLHGGSHVVGSPREVLGLTAGFVVRTGIPAVSLDYRLAPEHPFPADVQDVVAAYRELLETGHAPETIVFAGESAGGGLAITGALAARDAGLPRPAAIVALSPRLDATGNDDDLFDLYLADNDRLDPLLSPAVTADLTGLPPMLIQAGTDEVLLEDARRMARRATDAEVTVILDITARAPHVFQVFTDTLDEAGEALDRAALFVRQRTPPREAGSAKIDQWDSGSPARWTAAAIQAVASGTS